jgi:hypothetical protein
MSGKLKVKGNVMKGKRVHVYLHNIQAHILFVSNEDGTNSCKGTDESQIIELLRIDCDIMPTALSNRPL